MLIIRNERYKIEFLNDRLIKIELTVGERFNPNDP